MKGKVTDNDPCVPHVYRIILGITITHSGSPEFSESKLGQESTFTELGLNCYVGPPCGALEGRAAPADADGRPYGSYKYHASHPPFISLVPAART